MEARGRIDGTMFVSYMGEGKYGHAIEVLGNLKAFFERMGKVV